MAQNSSSLDLSDLGGIPDHDLSDLGGIPHEDQTTSSGMAALEHFGDSASLGYLPHIQAATEPAMSRVLDLITGNKVYDSLTPYAQRRDENISRLNMESKEHPTASIVGSVGGAIVGGAPISAILPITGASAIPRIANAAGVGAIVGAASNPGDLPGEVSGLQLSDRGKDAVFGAAVGAPAQALIEGGSALSKLASNALSSLAEKKAFKALGPYQRNVLQNAEDINAIGRTALDEGIIGKSPKSYETLAERAGAAKNVKGKQIENIVNEISDISGVPKLSRDEIAQNIHDSLVAKEGIPGISRQNNQVEALIDEFASGGKGKISLAEARDIKAALKKQINWDRLPGADIPIQEQVQRALYGNLRKGEDAIAENLASSGKIPNAGDFLNAKKSYGNLAQAESMASKRGDKEFANRFLGLTDYMTGGTGAALGGYVGYKTGGYEGAKAGAAIGGGAGAFGNKLARLYGNQIVAKAADFVSKQIAHIPQLADIASRNPAIIPILVENHIKNGNAQQEVPASEANRTPAINDPQLETAIDRVLKARKK